MMLYQVVNQAKIVPMFFEKTGIKPNVMISYAYQEGNMSQLTKTYRDMIGSLVLDSGAFSVFTGKKNIRLSEYTLFLRKYGNLFNHVFSLDDKFDDAEHNYENQIILENALEDVGIRPIPVVHDFEDPYKEFEMYVQQGHDYIALGSMGSREKISDEILGKIRTNYPEIMVHMFGTLKLSMLYKYRPESADSSGWAQQAGKGGSVYYWRSSENKKYVYNVGSVDSEASEKNHLMKSPFLNEILEFWNDKFGYTQDIVMSDPIARQILNLYFFTQYEDYLNNPESLIIETTKKTNKKKAKK